MAKRRNRAQKVNAAPAPAAARKPTRKAKAIKVTAETVVEPIVAVQEEPISVYIRKPDRFEIAINVMADFLTMIENRIRALFVKAA